MLPTTTSSVPLASTRSSARTRWPDATSARTAARPIRPAAPVTRIRATRDTLPLPGMQTVIGSLASRISLRDAANSCKGSRRSCAVQPTLDTRRRGVHDGPDLGVPEWKNPLDPDVVPAIQKLRIAGGPGEMNDENSDLYALDADAIKEPPQSLARAIGQIGPGLILAASIV